jgi:hypothetical protein
MMTYTHHKPAMKRVTMNLPADLVENAPQYLEKKTLTEAVRESLREAMHRKACQELLAMRGKVDMGFSWQELRAMDDD